MSHKLSPEIAAAFVEETRSYADQVRDAIRSWPTGGAPVSDQPRRLIHTIKGAAAMVGLQALAHAALKFEDTLKSFAAAPMQPGDVRLKYFEAALVSLDRYLEGIGRGDRLYSELEASLVGLRRANREEESGDFEAVRQVLSREEGTAPAPISQGRADLSADVSSDLLANFRQEGEELVLQIGRALRALKADSSDRQSQRELRRGVHSLKGAAQSVGQTSLAELTHALEDLLDELIGGKVEFNDEVSRAVYAAFDTISDLVSGEVDEAGGWDRVNQLRVDLAVLTPGEDEPAAEAEEAEDSVPPEFLEVFRPEADEHLTIIATGLRDIAANPGDKPALQAVRRSVHTLKGAAGVIGLMSVNTLAHQMEDLLEAAWDDSLLLTAEHQQLLFSTADVLADLIGEPSKHTEARARRRELLAQYTKLSGNAAPAPVSLRQPAPARSEEPVPEGIDIPVPQGEAPVPQRGDSLQASRYVRVPIERLDEMVRLVSELIVSRSTFEQSLDSYRHDVDEMRLTLLRLQRLSHRFDADFEAQALLTPAGAPRVNPLGPVPVDKRAEFDSLEFDRYTDLHLVARDLGETTADISVGVNQLFRVAGDFESYVNRMGRLTSDVQDRLMRMRMVPLANLATRLHRTVRVTAERLGKHVDLILDGEDIEMDKTALEELAGPLEHLLRNSIDHGIESEAVRRATGKRATGQVRVKAYYAGTQVMVEVSDDGRGIDAESIRHRAAQNGLISEATATALSDDEAFDLIFEPGFSTAASITEISGRGVGLDVVKTAVEKLKGSVKISSERGAGASFQLRLPMSLAILRVLMVKSGGNTYAVPLANISRILRLESGQLERLGAQQILRVNGQVLPALRLQDSLGGRTPSEDDATDYTRQPVLVVDTGTQQAAILVDELLIAREVVVKSLGSLVRRVHGVTGATILGDGSIVLIVNTNELFESKSATQSSSARTAAAVGRVRRRRMGLDVLVVDDSVSVRRVLVNLFRNQGWRPEAARDGMEALEMLQSGKRFDCVLLDMEMPRMDGYELLTLLRSQPQFASLPVIMLTSRAADKHRKKAFELGATDFLVKPYQDEALLAVINRVVTGAEAMAG